MNDSAGNENHNHTHNRQPRQVLPLEPRQLGLGEVFFKTPEAVVVAEVGSGRIVLWNDSAARVFGHSHDQAVGLLVEDLVPAALKQRHRDGLARFAREGSGELIDSGTTLELPAIHRDGTPLWVEMTLTPLAGGNLPGRYAMAIVRDVTERRQLEAELRATQHDLSVTVEQLERRARQLSLMNELADLLHACSTIEDAGAVISQMGARLFPTGSGALYLYAPSDEVLELVSPWGANPPPEGRIADDECRALRRDRTYVVDDAADEPLCEHAHGAERSVCVPMIAQGETIGLLHLRHPTGTAGAEPPATDLAETVAGHLALALANFALRERFRSQSLRDPLTDLYNRRHMEDAMEREVRRARRHGLELSVIAIDIDHFKSFNDAHGHEAGDMLLRALAGFLQTNVRAEDVTCRPGGEEFLVILPYASLEEAAARAEQLRVGAKSVVIVPRDAVGERSVTISLGVATLSRDRSTSGDLLRAADEALYRAKAGGRDRVAVTR